jgi:hypothetical protein
VIPRDEEQAVVLELYADVGEASRRSAKACVQPVNLLGTKSGELFLIRLTGRDPARWRGGFFAT